MIYQVYETPLLDKFHYDVDAMVWFDNLRLLPEVLEGLTRCEAEALDLMCHVETSGSAVAVVQAARDGYDYLGSFYRLLDLAGVYYTRKQELNGDRVCMIFLGGL